MSTTTLPQLLTGEDLLRLPDDGKDYELVRGALIEMPPLGGSHGDRQSCMAQLLRNFNDEAALGTVMTESGFYVCRDPDTVRGPDVLFVSREKLDPALDRRGAGEQWEIRLDPKTGELDLEGLRRREFTEYMTGDA